MESNAYRRPLAPGLNENVRKLRENANPGEGFINVSRASMPGAKAQKMFPTIDAHNHGTEGTLPDGQKIRATVKEDGRAQGFPDRIGVPARAPGDLPEEDDRERTLRGHGRRHREARPHTRAGPGSTA